MFANDSAGRMCAEMCGTACRVDPSITLKRFVPHIASRISEILEGVVCMNVMCQFKIIACHLDTDQIDSENPDVELVWNLQLLSNVSTHPTCMYM